MIIRGITFHKTCSSDFNNFPRYYLKSNQILIDPNIKELQIFNFTSYQYFSMIGSRLESIDKLSKSKFHNI